VKIWDASTGAERFTLGGHTKLVWDVSWSADGKRLAASSGDVVQIYAMEIHDLMKLARQRITAIPSRDGCKKYFRVDVCPPAPELKWW
jgi:WD40 repeat protein